VYIDIYKLFHNLDVRLRVSWEELGDCKLTAQSFTMKNIFQRLSRKSDPWKNLRHSVRSLKAARKRLDAIIKKELKR
jgi:bifunctional non-homologous end joining protein LigD